MITVKNISLAVVVLGLVPSCQTFKKQSNNNQQIKIEDRDFSAIKGPKRKYKNYVGSMFSGKQPILWNSDEGIKMLRETNYAKPFYELAHHFAIQQWPTSCGFATMRLVLSAIYENTNTQFLLDKKHSLLKDYNGVDNGRFVLTEDNIGEFYKGDEDDKDYLVVSRQKTRKNGRYEGGIDLKHLEELFNLHPHVNATTYPVRPEHMTKENISQFRKLIKDITSHKDKYLVVNYHLGLMYPFTSGHFSPVVAYHEGKDKVLIMDVAGHLGTWVWVDVEDLYRSMNAAVSGFDRGYIVIEQTK